jgi:hypothetical protein
MEDMVLGGGGLRGEESTTMAASSLPAPSHSVSSPSAHRETVAADFSLLMVVFRGVAGAVNAERAVGAVVLPARGVGRVVVSSSLSSYSGGWGEGFRSRSGSGVGNGVIRPLGGYFDIHLPRRTVPGRDPGIKAGGRGGSGVVAAERAERAEEEVVERDEARTALVNASAACEAFNTALVAAAAASVARCRWSAFRSHPWPSHALWDLQRRWTEWHTLAHIASASAWVSNAWRHFSTLRP